MESIPRDRRSEKTDRRGGRCSRKDVKVGTKSIRLQFLSFLFWKLSYLACSAQKTTRTPNMKILFLLFLLFLGFTKVYPTPTLSLQEVDVLKVIAKTMKKTNWNFGIDPCDTRSTNGGWRNPNAINGSEDFVSCNCTFDNNTLCHVTGIVIKSQDLQGSLPKELASLPFLQELILLGNRLTGTIPKEIGNIASLERL
ncbi:hypothetical protein YC2023_086753 [Brassica napus]